MSSNEWKKKNDLVRLVERLKHPWPFYKKVGGISAIVKRADGTEEDLGKISDTYIKRKGWSVGSGR